MQNCVYHRRVLAFVVLVLLQLLQHGLGGSRRFQVLNRPFERLRIVLNIIFVIDHLSPHPGEHAFRDALRLKSLDDVFGNRLCPQLCDHIVRHSRHSQVVQRAVSDPKRARSVHGFIWGSVLAGPRRREQDKERKSG